MRICVVHQVQDIYNVGANDISRDVGFLLLPNYFTNPWPDLWVMQHEASM